MKEYANQIIADADQLDMIKISPIATAGVFAEELVAYAESYRKPGEIMVIRVSAKIGTREELFPRKEAPDADAS